MNKLLKNAAILLLSLSSITGYSTHLVGGEITWNALGNDKYIIELKLFRQCSYPSAPINNLPTIINGPFGNINTTLVSSQDVSVNCAGGSGVNCTTGTIGSVELYIFRTDTLVLTGNPPASGWVFEHSNWGLPSGMVNLNPSSNMTLEIKSIMYENNVDSPQMLYDLGQYISAANKNLSFITSKVSPDDSLWYDIVTPQSISSNYSSASYSSGYSVSQPLPNPISDSTNGMISINHRTGMVSYDINFAQPGFYGLFYKIERWRNGTKLSQIEALRSVYVNIENLDSNHSPDASIDTALYSNISQNGTYSYSAKAWVGDTLEFVLTAQDLDTNLGAIPQVVTFDAAGTALDTMWSGLGHYNSKPVILPVLGQSGFSSATYNSVSFKWYISPDLATTDSSSHFFNFSLYDDRCAYVGYTNVNLEVAINQSINISADTVYVCRGDSVLLSGNTRSNTYAWSPVSNMIGSGLATPAVSPDSSTTYYLSDPQYPSLVDSVFVKVYEPNVFNLSSNPYLLSLTDSMSLKERTWFYNGVPFANPYDTISSFGLGHYAVVGQYGTCIVGDTTNQTLGPWFSCFDLVYWQGNPVFWEYSVLDSVISGSMGLSFVLDTTAFITEIALPGVSLDTVGGNSLINVKIYDQNQVEIASVDTSLVSLDVGVLKVKIPSLLTADEEYMVVVSSQGAASYKLIDSVSFPAIPYNKGVEILGSFKGGYKQYPMIPSSYMLPISMKYDFNGIGLVDNLKNNVAIYPNPAKERFTIYGLTGESVVQLLDVRGSVVESYTSTENSLTIERNSISSGIYFVKISDSNTTSLQKVLFK